MKHAKTSWVFNDGETRILHKSKVGGCSSGAHDWGLYRSGKIKGRKIFLLGCPECNASCWIKPAEKNTV